MLELKNISAGYGTKKVLDGIDAVFENGEITSVVGANGCGKSTLLLTCAGLILPSSGRALLDGEDISALRRSSIAQRLSYLAQNKSVDTLSVRGLVSHGRFPYLGYPRRYSARDLEKIDEAMTLAGVEDIADCTLGELSGGQQQRARIAMILAQDTGTILLDEPLTYLDIYHKFELMELIKRLKEMGKALVIVMHDLDYAFDYSDRIAVMQNGKITAFDTPERIAVSGALSSALGVEAAYSNDAHRYFFNIGKKNV